MTAPRPIERADLLVGELPVVRDQRAAVRVARPHRPREHVERLPEALVAEVRRVEDDAEPIHLAQQLAAAAPRPPVASVPCA